MEFYITVCLNNWCIYINFNEVYPSPNDNDYEEAYDDEEYEESGNVKKRKRQKMLIVIKAMQRRKQERDLLIMI